MALKAVCVIGGDVKGTIFFEQQVRNGFLLSSSVLEISYLFYALHN